MTDPIYEHFLGTWVLDTATCDYQQGEPPWADQHRIEADGDELVIIMDWTDADGETHHASFRGRPDGSRIPFDGTPLADALQITAPSPTELNLSAFRDGIELMTAQRVLADDGATLELTQSVNLPDGSSPSNFGIYVLEEAAERE